MFPQLFILNPHFMLNFRQSQSIKKAHYKWAMDILTVHLQFSLANKPSCMNTKPKIRQFMHIVHIVFFVNELTKKNHDLELRL